MARRPKTKPLRKATFKVRRKLRIASRLQRKSKAGFIIKKRRPGISDARLQRGLIVLRAKKEIAAAARAARTTPERFKRAALKKRAIKWQRKQWVVKSDLPRELPLFTDGRKIAVTVPTFASARLIGRYMSAVGHFIRTNDLTYLDPFVDRSVTDTAKKKHMFETRPNVLYRLTSSDGETFEQVYRIVV